MKIIKAIIPLAGRATRLLPATKSIPKSMLPVAGVDGILRPMVHYIVEAAIAGGITDICLVVDAASEGIFRHYFDDGKCCDFGADIKMDFVIQQSPKGLGDAVLQAKTFADGEAVLIMLGDYIYKVDKGADAPVKILLDSFAAQNCDSLVGLQLIGPDQLSSCGVVSGDLQGKDDEKLNELFEITKIIEKPSLDIARKELQIPGLPEDNWLAFFGLYAFANRIFSMLEACEPQGGELTLTQAQQSWLNAEGTHLGQNIPAKAIDLGTHDKFIAGGRY